MNAGTKIDVNLFFLVVAFTLALFKYLLMKKYIVLVVMTFSLTLSAYSQKIEWSVLKKELVGTYTGELKKGLANGKGTAKGQDEYTGDFKKGLPDGVGVYTDSLGNVYTGAFRNGKKEGRGIMTLANPKTDSVIKGYWEFDKYIGAERIEPYEVSNKTGSANPRIFSTGAGNRVEISIIDPVSHGFLDGTIFFTGQASPRTTSGRFYYEDAVFPLEFDIQYTCSNKLGTARIASTIRIKISKPGNWIVTINN